jgi:hypothetical protein
MTSAVTCSRGLAIISVSSKREDYVAKAAECLAQAKLIQDGTWIGLATEPPVSENVHGDTEGSKNSSSDPDPSNFA